MSFPRLLLEYIEMTYTRGSQPGVKEMKANETSNVNPAICPRSMFSAGGESRKQSKQSEENPLEQHQADQQSAR